MKHFFSLILLLSSLTVFGQNFWKKPYLEMQTVENEKEKIYRLRKNTVWIKTAFDSVLVKHKITGFTQDSGISLQNHGVIDPNDIEVICFTPRKFSRTVKQLFYLQGLAIEVLTITSIVKAGSGNNPDIILALFYPLFTVAIAEGLGAFCYDITPQKILRKNNTRFIIKYRNPPVSQTAPIPYKDYIPY